MIAVRVLAPLLLAATGCSDMGGLPASRVQTITVDGRRYEARLAPDATADEWRLHVVRATLVIDPDPEREAARGRSVAQKIIAETCKGRRHESLEDRLEDNVNLYVRFRCLA